MKLKRRSFLGTSTVFVGSGFTMDSFANVLSYDEKVLFGIIRANDIQGKGFNLRSQAAEAFDAMRAHALNDGIHIHSYSSHRSFEHQQKIWNRKFALFSKRVNKRVNKPEDVVREIIQYSTIPGTSRHHWGTDLDMIDNNKQRPQALLEPKNYMKGGVYHDLYAWLLEHGSDYGFYESYTNDPNRPGFEFEPWHWSFAELSIPMLEQWYSLPLTEKLPLKEVAGNEVLTEAFLDQYKQQWGLGINKKLIPASLLPKSPF